MQCFWYPCSRARCYLEYLDYLFIYLYKVSSFYGGRLFRLWWTFIPVMVDVYSGYGGHLFRFVDVSVDIVH